MLSFIFIKFYFHWGRFSLLLQLILQGHLHQPNHLMIQQGRGTFQKWIMNKPHFENNTYSAHIKCLLLILHSCYSLVKDIALRLWHLRCPIFFWSHIAFSRTYYRLCDMWKLLLYYNEAAIHSSYIYAKLHNMLDHVVICGLWFMFWSDKQLSFDFVSLFFDLR